MAPAVLAAAMAALPARGFMLLGWELAELSHQLFQLGRRVVLVAPPPRGAEPLVPCVYVDPELSFYLALRPLKDNGHRHILVQGSSSIVLSRRWSGVQRALAEAEHAGLKIKVEVVEYLDMLAWTPGDEAVRHYLQGPDPATALVAWNDVEAIKLIQTFSSRGISIPGDLSIVGCDNLPGSSAVQPPLTTIEGRIESQLEIALELLSRPEPPLANHVSVVTPHLVVRMSTSAV